MVYYYDMNNEHVVEEIANAIIHIIEQRDNTNAFIKKSSVYRLCKRKIYMESTSTPSL